MASQKPCPPQNDPSLSTITSSSRWRRWRLTRSTCLCTLTRGWFQWSRPTPSRGLPCTENWNKWPSKQTRWANTSSCSECLTRDWYSQSRDCLLSLTCSQLVQILSDRVVHVVSRESGRLLTAPISQFSSCEMGRSRDPSHVFRSPGVVVMHMHSTIEPEM
jgi:hypothetical protein